MSWKEIYELKDVESKYYYSSYYDINVNKYSVKCETSLRLLEKKGWVKSIDPCGWCHWCLRYWVGRKLYDGERHFGR